MRLSSICLLAAGLANADSGVFSVYDDLLAFPQYEVIFSDNYILDTDAQTQLSHDATSSILKNTQSSSNDDSNNPPSDLSPNSAPEIPPSDSETSSTPSSYHQMTLHSRPYLCAIPTISAPTNTTNTTVDPTAEAAELARATDRGWELLKGMEGNCMYFISGWWSYSFCYNTAVKQFHSLPPGKGGAPIFPPTEDPATPSYVLGKYDPAQHHPQQQLGASADPPPRSGSTKKGTHSSPSTLGLRTAGSTRYLSQTLTSGTTCDLTSRARKIEVQFHCHPQSADRIGWIKEVSTCSYLMGIYTPRLCNDVAFLPARETKAHAILCKEIIPSSPSSPNQDPITDYESRKRTERARKLLSANPSSSRPIVAGIEVGAMNHVGRPGQRLEPPAQIAPQHSSPDPNNNKVDLLARQESKEKGGRVYKLPDRNIKALGVEPRLVEEAVRELRQVAEGKAWRLEVYEGGMGGRELRGVVEPDGAGAGEGKGEEEVEFFIVAEGEGEGGDEGQGEDGDISRAGAGEDENANSEDESEEGSEEVYKDEL
ncbi:MAG: hypothetical protein Q9195_006097 [Heterodermia aff. obscurata]